MAKNAEAIPAVLEAKIRVPRPGAYTLRRQRLIDLLHRNLDSGLQVVSAPAGYGKTTLLGQFCADLDIPVCWYSLDSSDTDVEWLVKGILVSVGLHFPQSGNSATSRIAATERTPDTTSQLPQALARELRSIPDYFLLVLEDYHLVEHDRGVQVFMNTLIASMPENCHMLISSRTSVDIPIIHARVVGGNAAALTASDLAFSTDEIKELLKQRKATVPPDEVIERLAEDTGGWIVGLLLYLRQMLSSRPLEELPSISREEVFSYLASEAFESLPAETRGFLLKSSILDQIDPEFCDRLLGIRTSQGLLRELGRRGLFLSTVHTPRVCYQYHPLFRDFLREKLADLDPQQIGRLHGKAGALFEEERRWPEAIDHFVAARRYAKAAQVVHKCGDDLLKAGKWTSVSRWIDALPARHRFNDMELVLLRAECDVHTGHIDEAARALTRVIDEAKGPDTWLQRARALGWRSATYRLAGNLDEARSDITKSISLLEENGAPAGSLGDAYRRLGVIHLERGNLAAATKRLRRALKYYSATFDLGQSAAVHNSLGIAYREMGSLTKATVHLDLARQAWERVGNTGALASLSNNLGLVYQCQGDYDRALKTLRLGLHYARESGYRRMEACILISIGDVLRDSGLYHEALSSYEEGLQIAEEVMEIYYVTCATMGIGETERLLGDQAKAEALLRQALSQAQEHGRTYEAALVSVRLGIVEYEQGRYKEALSVLAEAGARLRDIGDKEALARTHFHMAQALFLSKDYGRAKSLLTEASRLADELGYDGFFAVEGRNATALLQYGASGGIGGGRFVRALQGAMTAHSARLQAAPETRPNRPASSRPTVEVFAFGEGRVLVNGRRVRDAEWRSARAMEIFLYLLSSEFAETREQIAVALWPDLSPAKSTSNFHISLYRARHALLPGIVAQDEGRYRVARELGIWFDVAEFSQAVDQVRDLSTDAERRAALLQRAVDLYRGPFLPALYSEWAEDRRRELESKYVRAVRTLARWYCENGDFQRTLSLLEKTVAIDPYDELLSDIEEWGIPAGRATVLLKEYTRYVNRLRGGDAVPAPRARLLRQ